MIESNSPVVSVIMSVYNCASSLPASIESVFWQSFSNWEFIICDDGSNDDTYAIAWNYARKDKRIKLLKNDKNHGIAFSLNRCIAYSTGKYLARHDGDDRMTRERLKKQVDFLTTHPEYAMVGTSMALFDEKGQWGIRIAPEKPDKMTLMKTNPFGHPTVMMRASVIKGLNGYSDTDLTRKRLEDVELWFRIYAAGYQGYNLQEPLHQYSEDRIAYQKRKPSYRFFAFKLWIQGGRMLSLPWWVYVFTLKHLLAAFVPGRLMRIYHRKRDAFTQNI